MSGCYALAAIGRNDWAQLDIGATELRCDNGTAAFATLNSQLIVFLVFWTQFTRVGRSNTQILHNGR